MGSFCAPEVLPVVRETITVYEEEVGVVGDGPAWIHYNADGSSSFTTIRRITHTRDGGRFSVTQFRDGDGVVIGTFVG